MDAADLFVFLAGWSLRLMADGGGRQMPTRDVMLRLFGRALELYAAQVLITMLAIAMLAVTAIELSNPLLLQWHNAAAVFNDPVPTHIGLAVLTHQLGYFDILPLYVVLMLMAPFFAALDRYAPRLVLPASLALYVAVLDLPPDAADLAGGRHLVLQSPRLAADFRARLRHGARRFRRRRACAPSYRAAARFGAADRDLLRSRRAVRLVMGSDRCAGAQVVLPLDKSWATPARLFQFLALVAVGSLLFPYIRRLSGFEPLRRPLLGLIGLLALLGRNSLYVFCIGSLLSLTGQIGRFYYRGSVGIDTVVVISGIIIMAFTAWLAESRQRNRPARPAPSVQQL